MSSATTMRRKLRARRKVRTANAGGERLRLSVHRSSKHIYAQIIDDARGVTVAAASSAAVKTGTKTDTAAAVGRALAEVAAQRGIKAVAFDRGAYRYHGRVKALADAAREGGLDF